MRRGTKASAFSSSTCTRIGNPGLRWFLLRLYIAFALGNYICFFSVKYRTFSAASRDQGLPLSLEWLSLPSRMHAGS